MHLPGGQLVFKPSCFGNGVGATCEVSEAAAIALGFFFFFISAHARSLGARAHRSHRGSSQPKLYGNILHACVLGKA